MYFQGENLNQPKKQFLKSTSSLKDHKLQGPMNIYQSFNSTKAFTPAFEETSSKRSYPQKTRHVKAASSSSSQFYSQNNFVVNQNGIQEFTPYGKQTPNNQTPEIYPVNVLQLCNLAKLDEIQKKFNLKQKRLSHEFILTTQKKNRQSASPPKYQDNSQQRKQKTKIKIMEDLKFFRTKLPTRNFTLKHIQKNLQEIDQNTKPLEEYLTQNKLQSKQQDKSQNHISLKDQSFNSDQQTKEPNFNRYIKNQPIRRYDMVFNVKHLVRLQEKRQKQLIKKEPSPEMQLELIRRQNQIKVLLANEGTTNNLRRANRIVSKQMSGNIKNAEELINRVSEQNLKNFQ